jgi:rare lipoprotein A
MKRISILLPIAVFCLLPLAAFSPEGEASWYGGKFQGRRTANGEIFDTNKFTAAHKTLPFGTLVRVLNLANSRSVVVRINDRGPFVEGRIIDLSKAAADTIGLSSMGVARVRIEAIGRVGGESSPSGGAPEKSGTPTAASRDQSSGLVTLQAGSFSRAANAEALKSSLESIGLSPVLEQRGALTRVLLKNIERSSLSGLDAKLKSVGILSVLIMAADKKP